MLGRYFTDDPRVLSLSPRARGAVLQMPKESAIVPFKRVEVRSFEIYYHRSDVTTQPEWGAGAPWGPYSPGEQVFVPSDSPSVARGEGRRR